MRRTAVFVVRLFFVTGHQGASENHRLIPQCLSLKDKRIGKPLQTKETRPQELITSRHNFPLSAETDVYFGRSGIPFRPKERHKVVAKRCSNLVNDIQFPLQGPVLPSEVQSSLISLSKKLSRSVSRFCISEVVSKTMVSSSTIYNSLTVSFSSSIRMKL